MVGYKLSKNDWVTPFFVIFRSVREKLLVTVSFDHPVLQQTYDDNFHHGRESLTRRMATHVFNASLHIPRNQITSRYLPDIFRYIIIYLQATDRQHSCTHKIISEKKVCLGFVS